MSEKKSKAAIYLLVLTLLILLTLVAVHLLTPRLKTRKEDCKCQNLKEPKYRIVNGTKSRQLEEGLPWIGFLFIRGYTVNGTFVEAIFCSLTIIGRYWALTGK